MVQDASLQIFLTIYHGQLLATFLYDYVVRNTVKLFFVQMNWSFIMNVIIGLLFSVFVIWAILSVWSKIRRNLVITTVILILMLIVRLTVGIPSLMNRSDSFSKTDYAEELAVFVVQMVIHFIGIVATWMLASKQSTTTI